MERLETLRSILDRFIEFIDSERKIMDTHNIQFLIENHWSEKIIKPTLFSDLEKFIEFQLNSKDNLSKNVNLIKYYESFRDTSLHSKESLTDLELLFVKLHQLTDLWNNCVLTKEISILNSTKELDEFDQNINKKFSIIEKQNRFMNNKKSYEVDLMSKFVAKLCKRLNIFNIVDIGSGRAYLSAQLSSSVFDNLFNVIAIDSSESNVTSSMKRLSIMKRKTTVFNSDKSVKKSEKQDDEDNFKTFSQFIQSNTELYNLVKEHDPDFEQSNRGFALIGLHSCGNLSNSIMNLFFSNNNENNNDSDCNIKTVRKLLCNVGCCYNLLNEKYAIDKESNRDYKNTNIEIDNNSKFPLSKYLNDKKYHLSFNLRMLSCHSLERSIQNIDDFKELNSLSLWYRSLLQVILLENYSAETGITEAGLMTEIQLGRNLINEKSIPTFDIYVRKALERLKFDQNKLDDSKIAAYYDRYSNMKPRFDAYIQFKLILAPIIEYLILLDRLCYLLEATPDFNNHLVKLFDPALSPRCHAIISYN